MKKGLVLLVVWLLLLIVIDIQAQGIRILSDDFFRASRMTGSSKVSFGLVVLDKSEIPDQYQLDSLEVLGRFRVYDYDLGWTVTSGWRDFVSQDKKLERNLEKFDVKYGRDQLMIFVIGLVDKHYYRTGERPDSRRGHTLGYRRAHQGISDVKRELGDNFPVFYAGYKFNQPYRGVEYIVCRRQRKEVDRLPVIPLEPTESTGIVESKGSGFYPYVIYNFDGLHTSTTRPVNQMEIGMGYGFSADWYGVDVKFSPLVYRRERDYYLTDTHQYSAAAVHLSGKLTFGLLEFSGRESFYYDIEETFWDENVLWGEVALKPWYLRLRLRGETAWVNFLESMRLSPGRMNTLQGRAGFAFSSPDKNHQVELGYQITVAKFMDEYWERKYNPRIGGVYLNYNFAEHFYLDFSWERMDVITLDKVLYQVIDPPVNVFTIKVLAKVYL